jgi:hypothetical protein
MTSALSVAEKSLTRLTEQAEAQRTAAENAGQRALTLQQEAVAGANAAGTAMLQGLEEARKSVSDFLADRIRQDIEVQSQLMACRTLDDLREVQTRFFRSAVDQYSAEASRMMKLGTDVVSRSIPRSKGKAL